jgi:uncharacterized protein YecE (DUF72 family)
MPRVLVGLPSLVGKLATYAQQYDLVELRPVDTPLPKPSKLAEWRKEVPPHFAFCVCLPAAVASLRPGPELDAALAQTLAAANALEANALVLATTAAVRPTAANRERIVELGQRLPKHGHLLAWHAAGIWEAEDVMPTAQAGNWLPVFDAAQEPLPPGPVVYTRIRALGHATRLGADRIERVARQLAGRREAFVVVEGTEARKVRAALKSAVEQLDEGRPVPMLFRPRVLHADDEEQ